MDVSGRFAKAEAKCKLSGNHEVFGRSAMETRMQAGVLCRAGKRARLRRRIQRMRSRAIRGKGEKYGLVDGFNRHGAKIHDCKEKGMLTEELEEERLQSS
ncbi:hypothetical protein GQ600_23314 [Phytophthora cactorum]|nr:hypothetical protein GQ600_23314 [Phytophthora cactorum]